MAVIGGNYLNCPVLIYDDEDNNIARTKIIEYDSNSKRVVLEETPPELKDGDTCRLLILAEPSPLEYQGRMRKDLWGTHIALFRGQEREARGAVRHKVNMSAFIENLIVEGRAYALHTPQKIQLMNISVGGMRFRAPRNTINHGDRFQTSVVLKDEKKLLIAEVVNTTENHPQISEYGCRFLIAGTSGA